MASWQSILAVVGGGLFVYWFLNKGGCQGDGGLTGEGTPLCYTGPTIEEFLGGLKGSGGDAEDLDLAKVPESTSEADEQSEAASEVAAQKWRSENPRGIIPAAKKAAWAHAYLVQNSITVA